MRERFSTEEIAEKLTYSEYLNMHLEEPIILHQCMDQHPYFHWIEHYHSLFRYVNGQPPTYKVREKFKELKFIISAGLQKGGFNLQADEIMACASEGNLNQRVIRQYTDEQSLYRTVNQALRECHKFQNFETSIELNEFDSPFAAWILQLNACIRQLPHFEGVAYRGTTLSETDINQYKIGDMLIWAPFVSASKDPRRCFGGNVLFEIENGEHFMGLNDKAYPRDISSYSIFPDEEEVLYPVACAFRVKDIVSESKLTTIRLKTLDSY